jgi:AcrR family transcriptional regulator
VSRVDRRKREVRERLLGAAFDLFLERGVESTTIDDICERADVANRTFFNHFSTRRDMLRTLAEGRLSEPFDVAVACAGHSTSARLIGVFDDIAGSLDRSGNAYRKLIGEMIDIVGYAVQPGTGYRETFLELITEGMARDEIAIRHDAQTLTDIVVATLSGAIVDWAGDRSHSPETSLHDLGIALADLLTAETSKTARG